jgi:hypothetical protein
MSDTETIHGPQQSAPHRPGPDSAEARVAALDGVEERFMREAGAVTAKLASPAVVETFTGVRSAIHKAATQSGMARAELDRLRSDPANRTNGVLNDGARMRIEELEQKAPAVIQNAYADALASVDVLAAQLVVGAMPKIEGQERSDAVEEVKMILEGNGGEDLISAMRRIAGGSNRRHAAVVTGSWGHARLGGDDKLHGAIQLLALEGAKKYGTPEQRAHAEAYTTLPVALRKAIAVSSARSRQRVGGSF